MGTREQNEGSIRVFKTFMEPSVNLQVFQAQLKAYMTEVFKWEGLPDEVNPSIIEEYLYSGGNVGFYYDVENMTYYTLPAVASSNKFDVYGRPTEYTLITKNGDFRASFKNLVPNENFILIKNTTDSQSSKFFIDYYASHMAQNRTITDNNVLMLAKRLIVETKDKSLKDSLNIFKDIYNLSIAIFSTQKDEINKNIDNVKVHSFDVDPKLNDLMSYFTFIKSECLTELGINNTGVEKKERLVVDEVNANNMQILNGIAGQMLREREQAVEKINSLYGLNIRVSRRIAEPEPIGEVVEDEI